MFAGSFALTINNKTALDAIQAKLASFLDKKAKSVAGKINQDFVRAGLTQGFAGGTVANQLYEDGNIPSLFTIADPETDQRPA
jgi:hypothetical protein